MKKQDDLGQVFYQLLLTLVALALYGLIIMLCWNYVVANILKLEGYLINFWQAIVIRLLVSNMTSHSDLKTITNKE